MRNCRIRPATGTFKSGNGPRVEIEHSPKTPSRTGKTSDGRSHWNRCPSSMMSAEIAAPLRPSDEGGKRTNEPAIRTNAGRRRGRIAVIVKPSTGDS
jgi:hypothetical protein